MKLAAMMVVHNEADRYLRPCLESLELFCDEISVLNDGSTDDTFELLDSFGKVRQTSTPQAHFYEHEGRTRQALLDWTMESHPTHILAIDADEFVADGQALRNEMEEESSSTGVWKLSMEEVWKADDRFLYLRMDGDWKPRPVGIAYRVPSDHWTNRQIRRHYRMHEKALACGRTPLWITMAGNRTTTPPVTEILHFGWACEADRAARYERYAVHDGGQFHANKHLESIMWDDERVKLGQIKWPPALKQGVILERVRRT